MVGPIYDAENKIWSHPLKIVQPKITLGEIILKKLNENDPNKIIEVNYDNGEKLTSSQLKKLTITIAKNLLNLGIKKGDVILFFCGFNEMITPIVLACYTIGAAVSPIDLNFTDDDADYIINLLNPTVILYDPIFKNRIESTLKRISLQKLKYVLSFASTDDGKSVPEMLCKPVNSIDDFEAPDLGDPDRVIAGLVLTSGTTGRPKLISLSHSHMSVGNTSWILDGTSVIYLPTPFRWIGPVMVIISPIINDCLRVFSVQKPTPELCLDIMRKYGVTNFAAVDGLLRKILHYAEKEQLQDSLKTLRYLVTGGERVSTVTYDLVKTLIPNCILITSYGMTELAGAVTSTKDCTTNITERGSGYVVEGFSLKIIDDNNKSLGPNQNGQICVRGRAPHLKYYRNDKINSEIFTNDEWYLTGDYGKFDDKNCIHVFNRCKDLIRCGEHIVIPSIFENRLEKHNAIKNGYIVGISDVNKGEIPIAFIKLNSDVSNDPKSQDDLKNDINEFLKPILPSNELHPINIFIVDNFPYTSCEKVDKIILKQWAKEYVN